MREIDELCALRVMCALSAPSFISYLILGSMIKSSTALTNWPHPAESTAVPSPSSCPTRPSLLSLDSSSPPSFVSPAPLISPFASLASSSAWFMSISSLSPESLPSSSNDRRTGATVRFFDALLTRPGGVTLGALPSILPTLPP